MKYTKKNRKYKHNYTKKQGRKYRQDRKYKQIKIPSYTPLDIRELSNKIADNLPNYLVHPKSSYAPTINNDLVTLKSIPRKPLLDCNINDAFQLRQPLLIGIPGILYGQYCYNYNTPEAKKYLLKNLSANKHIEPNKIIPPIQSQSNCWFNAMFVTFFVSDKGRKFFHFLRQLMIEGKQKNGDIIPENLRNAFALLNFGIDACLTGNKYAYELDTNSIIHELFNSIPKSYRNQHIIDVKQGGNPILYYISIINYLNNNSVLLLFMRYSKSNWKDKLVEIINTATHLPHIIVLEVFDEDASDFNRKPISFNINEAKYKIDSAIVRDISKQHFCATLTCERKEMAYDGMSFHRLVPLEWKDRMNTNINWQFADTNANLVWNFTKCYQLLMYYRVF